jgi:hypothetical protein
VIHEDYTPRAEPDGERRSQLELFPFSTYESFCQAEWVGRESEWFRIFNLLHWTASYLSHQPPKRMALLQPESPHLLENLSAHLDDGQIICLTPEAERSPRSQLAQQLEEEPSASLNLILATGVFGVLEGHENEPGLLRTCHQSLADGGYLLGTFPLQDELGNALTARNFQFLDAATRAGFEQDKVLGCDGMTRHLSPEFWAKVRAQGRSAFDTVLHAFSLVSDDPATLWMSRTAFYAGIKR